MVEKPTESKIKIKILNPDEVIVTSSLNENKKPHLLGSKTEQMVSKV